MLSDERLQQLLRDAHSLNTFESGDPVPARSVVRKSFPRWVLYAAAAIALYVGVQVSLDTLTPRTQPSIVVKPEPHATDLQPAAQPLSSLLLAVYQNAAGNLSCVNWSPDALKGREMSSFSAEELTRMGLALSCDPQATRILVVGLEGPASALPSSDDRAKIVAQCLSATPPCAPGTFNPKTCASAGCLDTEVKVRIESLALR